MHVIRTAAALALAALLVAPATGRETRAERAEARFAAMVEGRTAGAPADCIRNGPNEGLEIIDGVGFAFRRGDTLWVNRPGGAEFLDDDDVPVIRTWSGSRLCRLDRVEMHSRSSLIPGPVTVLGRFVPYRRSSQGT